MSWGPHPGDRGWFVLPFWDFYCSDLGISFYGTQHFFFVWFMFLVVTSACLFVCLLLCFLVLWFGVTFE